MAEDIIDSGASGANGASGIIGKKGGGGEAAAVELITADFFNTATAKGGKGGNGGSSLLLFPGGSGGKGGGATANLQAGGQDYPADEESKDSGDVAATGGDGGNGGGGLIKGNGGAGGGAQASGTNSGNPGVFGSTPEFSLLVNAKGGRGGDGLTGGAGGRGDASGLFTAPSGGTTVQATASGGDGGSAILKGGNGGGANAQTTYDSGGQPALNFSTAVATGGNGGDSAIGLNGNGGAATAEANGRHGSRGEGIDVSATARGGDSGRTVTPFAAHGNGGDAYATAVGAAFNLPTDASAQSNAQGGDGVLHGGNAVATAIQSAAVGGNAKAEASGGAGKFAGAAIATASASNDDGFGIASAISTANYAGKFVRQVAVSAAINEVFSDREFAPGIVYTQARVGDTADLLVAAPAPTANPGLVARAAVPTTAEATIALAGNPTVANTFAGGSVWGIGDFAAVNTFEGIDGPFQIFDSLNATSSYTFDIGDITNPQHLLLGLLDSNLAGDSIGNFRFSIAGEGTTFFEHDFTGSDFLSFFDDRIFDLGTWANRVGADGLLNLDISFAGYVPEIGFAFGQAADGGSSVPEPSTLALLLAGVLAMLTSRRLRSGRPAQPHQQPNSSTPVGQPLLTAAG